MRGLVLLLASTVLASIPARAVGEDQKPANGRVFTIESAPDSLRGSIEKAQAATRAMQGLLLDRLAMELSRGGIAAALAACREQAPALSERVAREQGIALGRTSHRLRNPANAPRPWVVPFVTEFAGKKYEQAQPRVVDLGDRVGVVLPIPMVGMCSQCHGRPEALAVEAQEAIRSLYPRDRAVGFATGDLRGWVWAEVRKDSK